MATSAFCRRMPFFTGCSPGEEITVEIESGKSLIIKFLTASEPHPDGTRTLFFELNGQPREVNVRDRALRVVERTHPKADPADPGQVAAPTAGVISSIAVQANQAVERGAKLLTLEAMKMQSNIYAPISGRVSKLLGYVTGKTWKPKICWSPSLHELAQSTKISPLKS